MRTDSRIAEECVADGGGQPATASPARQCGTYTLCCKLIEVAELDKPQNVWCSHCAPGKGCRIYEQRPGNCRSFKCAWLVDMSLGEEWRPDRAKFVIAEEPGTGRHHIVCEATAPGAWRREPFYSVIKSFLKRPGMERQQIVVTTGRKLTLLVPDGEFDLGEWKKGDRITVKYDQNKRVVDAALEPAT